MTNRESLTGSSGTGEPYDVAGVGDVSLVATLKRPTVSPPHAPRHWRMRIMQDPNAIPLALLAVFLLISLITVFHEASRYGITIDEPLQQTYGTYILKWYVTHGKDTSFLTRFPVENHMPEHGGVFDGGLVAMEHIFKHSNPWMVRHIFTGLTGWLGLIAIALCGFELGGPWVALVGAVGLWLYPRYYGSIYNNPKDIPAAVSFTFVIWATLLLVNRWKRPEATIGISILLGCFIGAATAIRATALSWFAVLALLLVGWWVINYAEVWRERRTLAEVTRQFVVAQTIGVFTMLSMMALWPFIFVSPIINLIEAVRTLSHYPWDGSELFNGVDYAATKLPASYLPTWFVIGSPPMLLALVALGVAVVVAEMARRRRVNVGASVAVLSFAIPLSPLLLLHPVLYDNLRQVLYLIPSLVLIGAYGLVRTVMFLRKQERPQIRWLAVALVGLTVVSYGLVLVDMIQMSPYEYAYFSPVVGGIQGAEGKYYTDFYGTCTEAAAKWLGQNYEQYTSSTTPTLDASFLLKPSLIPYLPSAIHFDGTHPDFFIGFTRFNNEKEYPNYRVIHVVAAEGAPLCVIKVNPAISPQG